MPNRDSINLLAMFMGKYAYEQLGAVRFDSMGLGYVAYWPNVDYDKPEEEW